MTIELQAVTTRLARLAVGAAIASLTLSASALTLIATSPDFVGSGQPPASQVVGSFALSALQLAPIGAGSVTDINVSGVWGGGAYQDGVGNYLSAPSDLFLGGAKVATCGPYDACSNGYNPIYDGLQTWSYSFAPSDYGSLLSTLASGPLVLTARLDSPLSQNYPNDLTHLQFSLSTSAVAAVPEPSAALLLVAGLGIVGRLSRKRKLPGATTC